MKKTIALVLSLLMLFALCACGKKAPATAPATAQETKPEPVAEEKVDFPTETITIIVCRGAGGSADTIARMFAPYLANELGCNVIVDNIEGGSGKVGLSQVFRADPDGYTLVLGNFPSYVLTEVIEGEDIEYHMNKFEPIVGISGKEGNALIVPGDSQFDTLEDLVNYAKDNPGKLNMAVTSGVSNSALAQAMFLSVTGVEMTSIPYDSGNKCVTATMGKEVDCAVCSSTATYTPFADGNLKVLAVFGEAEDTNLGGVPTFSSLYGDEYAYDVVMGVLAPPETPEAILTILREAAQKAVNDPEFAEAAGTSFNVVPRTYDELENVIETCYTLAEDSKDLIG